MNAKERKQRKGIKETERNGKERKKQKRSQLASTITRPSQNQKGLRKNLQQSPPLPNTLPRLSTSWSRYAFIYLHECTHFHIYHKVFFQCVYVSWNACSVGLRFSHHHIRFFDILVLALVIRTKIIGTCFGYTNKYALWESQKNDDFPVWVFSSL